MAQSRLTEVDRQVGQRVQALRLERGLSEAQLAGMLGLSGRAVADVESGRRALTCVSMLQVAALLRVDVPVLFGTAPPAGPDAPADAEARPDASDTREARELVRLFLAIVDPRCRNAVLKEARRLASLP